MRFHSCSRAEGEKKEYEEVKTHNKVAKLRFPNATNIYFPVDDETKIIQLKTLH